MKLATNPPADSESAEKLPLKDRTIAAYKELADAAGELNSVSDTLGKFIKSVDLNIQRLNIGVEAWVDTDGGWKEPNGEYEDHYLGYAKVGTTWGLALRQSNGHEGVEGSKSQTWLFNDAPRAMRVEAIDKLPDLLLRLKKKAESTAKKIAAQTDTARELSAALKQAVTEIGNLKK